MTFGNIPTKQFPQRRLPPFPQDLCKYCRKESDATIGVQRPHDIEGPFGCSPHVCLASAGGTKARDGHHMRGSIPVPGDLGYQGPPNPEQPNLTYNIWCT